MLMGKNLKAHVDNMGGIVGTMIHRGLLTTGYTYLLNCTHPEQNRSDQKTYNDFQDRMIV